MTKRISFSESHLSIAYIWEWFEVTKESLEEHKIKIKSLVHNSTSEIPVKYLGKSLNDIDQDFSHHLEELENTACLSLLAAAEAILRMEYLKRVYKRGKDPLSRDFRELYKKKENKAHFEEDILNIWSKNYPNLKGIIGELKGALKLRHWLAHGRYWEPKRMGRKLYDAHSIYTIADSLISNFNLEFY